jgi:hypothetical protein
VAAERTTVLVCACTEFFVCSRCKGTPFDPAYYDDEPGPMSEEAFGDLMHEPRLVPPQMFGEVDGP